MMRKPWPICALLRRVPGVAQTFRAPKFSRVLTTCEMMLVNMAEGGFISAHDYRVAKAAATALCGGEVDRGSLVDEEWLLKLERTHFVELAQQEKTQARIAHMLKTGKPLRN